MNKMLQMTKYASIKKIEGMVFFSSPGMNGRARDLSNKKNSNRRNAAGHSLIKIYCLPC
jgi:hypothetical protein